MFDMKKCTINVEKEFIKSGPRCYTTQDLNTMPQCPSVCPPQNCGPRYISVQQPPRLVCQKKVIYTKRTVCDKRVVPCTRQITEPKLIYTPKTLCEPKVVYYKRVIPEPKIIFQTRTIPDPKVVYTPRVICEPKEICQTLVCQPKPQTVQIPQAKEFCCYASAPPMLKCQPGCSPALPCSPCGPCDPYCGPCGPCGPLGPCEPCCLPC